MQVSLEGSAYPGGQMGPAPSAPASEFPSQQEVSSCAGIAQHTFVHRSQSNMQKHLPLRNLDHPSYLLTRPGKDIATGVAPYKSDPYLKTAIMHAGEG